MTSRGNARSPSAPRLPSSASAGCLSARRRHTPTTRASSASRQGAAVAWRLLGPFQLPLGCSSISAAAVLLLVPVRPSTCHPSIASHIFLEIAQAHPPATARAVFTPARAFLARDESPPPAGPPPSARAQERGGGVGAGRDGLGPGPRLGGSARAAPPPTQARQGRRPHLTQRAHRR